MLHEYTWAKYVVELPTCDMERKWVIYVFVEIFKIDIDFSRNIKI